MTEVSQGLATVSSLKSQRKGDLRNMFKRGAQNELLLPAGPGLQISPGPWELRTWRGKKDAPNGKKGGSALEKESAIIFMFDVCNRLLYIEPRMML